MDLCPGVAQQASARWQIAFDMPTSFAPPLRTSLRDFIGKLMSVDRLAACALMFTLLSGKLSYSSLLPDHLLPTFLFEFRLWGVVALIVLLRSSLRDAWGFREPILVGTLCLLAFLVGRSIGLDNTAVPILDALYLSIEVGAVAILAKRRESLKTMRTLALALAVLLFLLALWGVKNEDLNGAGWAPIGGPITFYRIEYLGLCIALYCFLARPRIVYLLMIGVFFFATWSSLSKIALVASIVALAPVYVVGLARNQYKQLLLLSSALLVAYFTWHAQLGSTMQLRVAQSAVLQQGQAGIGQDGRQPSRRIQIDCNTPSAASAVYCASEADIKLADAKSGEQPVTHEQEHASRNESRPETPSDCNKPRATNSVHCASQADIKPVEATPGDRALNPGQDFSLRGDYCLLTAVGEMDCLSSTLTDRSGRLLMFAEAMRGFAQSPIIGNGLGQYTVRSINLNTQALEGYDYPHNILAEMAFSGGVIALGLMMLILAFAAHMFVNVPLREPRAAALVSFGIFMFLSALAAGDFYDLRLFLCLCVGISVIQKQALSRPGRRQFDGPSQPSAQPN